VDTFRESLNKSADL
jgi:hypothetical protein